VSGPNASKSTISTDSISLGHNRDGLATRRRVLP
jgi:hypothetical protein